MHIAIIKQNQVHEVTHLNMCFVLFEVSHRLNMQLVQSCACTQAV